MKKRTLLLLIVLVALTALAVVAYLKKNQTSTLNKNARDFAVADTATIDKVFLADKNGQKVTLERTKTGWVVDGEFPARQDCINTLLKTIKSVAVKTPVANLHKESVLKGLITQSIKVEIYQEGDLVKQYYVGSSDNEHEGTYMVLTDLDNGQNFEEPFVTYIPGFQGYLTTRYFTDRNDWRNRMVSTLTPPEIKSIRMDLFEVPDSSFVIDVKNTNSFELKKVNAGDALSYGEVLPFDEMKMKQFIAYFQNLEYEFFLVEGRDRILDTLKQMKPFARLTVTEAKGEKNVMNFYHKKSIPEKNKMYGVDYVYDPDRLYMKFDGDKKTVIIQYYVFGKVLQNYGYFLPQQSVKK